jgi:hypothetical protein
VSRAATTRRRRPAVLAQVDRWPEWIRVLYREQTLSCTRVVMRVIRGRLPASLRRGHWGEGAKKLAPGLWAIDIDDVGIAERDGKIEIDPRPARTR